MQLKRYTTTELTPILTDIFYDYMIKESNNGKTGIEEVTDFYNSKIEEYKDRIRIYDEALKNKSIEEDSKESLTEQLNYLKEGLKCFQYSNRDFQYKYYQKTKATDFCRSTVRISLNKKINSFYDDLYLNVLFYDDICTPCGKGYLYNLCQTYEDKLDFLIKNTSITNMGLVYAPRNQIRAVIAVVGKLNHNNPRVETSNIELLDSQFSDFDNLKLSDINIIQNNDLKQFLQSKIDLDKENMKKLSSINIRGDVYEIYKSPYQEYDNNIFYIRYVCRSTGRVYYNKLNLNNLALSKYYNKNDYKSYAKAWWNLNTLGSSIEGKPIVRQ